MYKSMFKGFFLFILTMPLFAQYSFDFSCLGDTISEGTALIEFYFRLENTGFLPDSYAFDCRVIDSVPGWIEIYCVGGTCGVPGETLYKYLGVGGVDTTIHLSIFTTPGYAIEVINMHVQSVNNTELQDSINVYATGMNGIQENEDLSLSNVTLTVYPNPFSHSIDIRYSIGQSAEGIGLKIYDATGRLVKDFSRFSTYALRPTHIVWDGTDDQGLAVPAGIYFITLEGNSFKKIDKIIRLR